jgi:hypothetical protein
MCSYYVQAFSGSMVLWAFISRVAICQGVLTKHDGLFLCFHVVEEVPRYVG